MILDSQALPRRLGSLLGLVHGERCESNMGLPDCSPRTYHFLNAKAESSSSVWATHKLLQRLLWLVRTLMCLHQKCLLQFVGMAWERGTQVAFWRATRNFRKGFGNAQHLQLRQNHKNALLCFLDLNFECETISLTIKNADKPHHN